MRKAKCHQHASSWRAAATGCLLLVFQAVPALAYAQQRAPNIVVTNVTFVGTPKKGPCNQVRISFRNDGNETISTPFDIGISFDQRSPSGIRVPVDWGYKRVYDINLPANASRTVGFLDVELPVPDGVPIVAQATAGLPFATSGSIWGWVDMPFDNDYGAIDEAGNTWEWASGTLDPHDTTDNAKVIPWQIEGYCATLRVADAFTSAGQDAVFTVSMSPASKDNIVLGYVTRNGSARGGRQCLTSSGKRPDFLHRKGTVTFSPGETQKTVRIPTCPGREVMSSKTFTIQLGEPEFATLPDNESTGHILPLVKRLPELRRKNVSNKEIRN